MEEKSAFETFELSINKEIKGFLSETTKWTYFLSVLGFVGIGMLLLLGVFVAFSNPGSQLMWGAEQSPSSAYKFGYTFGITFFYVLLAVLYFFPVLYLFKFSRKMKSALKLSNNNDFKMAFLNLKSHYKFMGIFAIVIISIYILVIIGGIFSAMSI